MDQNYKVEKLSDSKYEFKFKLDGENFEKSYKALMSERMKNYSVKGFRKGEVPADMVDDATKSLVLTQTFERLAPLHVNNALVKEEIIPVAPPSYKELGDMASGKDVEFTVEVTVMPEFKIVDLKKVKIKPESIKVTAKEVDEALQNMKLNNGGDDDTKMDDAWAAGIAEKYQFEDVKDMKTLKAAVKDLITNQKKNLVNQSAADNVMAEIKKLSKIAVPEEAIAYEASQREQAFLNDLKEINVTAEDFCKRQGVEYKDLAEKWSADAKDALESDVILREYAKSAKVETTDAELQEEVNRMKAAAMVQHEAHGHEEPFNEEAYQDPQWQAQISTYLQKQKAFRAILSETLGEDFLDEAEGKPEEKSKSKKKTAKKSSKK